MSRHDDEADGGEESGSAEAGAQPRGGPLLHRPHVPDHTSPEVETHYHYLLSPSSSSWNNKFSHASALVCEKLDTLYLIELIKNFVKKIYSEIMNLII